MGPRRRRRSGRGLDVRIELAVLALGDPDADQGAREVVLTCQGVEGRSGRVLLHDLLLERETVDAMTSHGLTPARPSSLVNRRLSAYPAGGAHSKSASIGDRC